MRLLSLLLCFALIVFLYIRDMKQKTHFSQAFWVSLIWVLIVYSRSVSGWLNPAYSPRLESSISMDEGNSLERSIAIIFFVIGLIILWTRKINWPKIIHDNGWLIWLYYYCSISILWSDQLFISFKRLIRDLVNVVMVLVILTDTDPIEALKAIIRRCMYVLVPLSIVLIKYFPEYGRYWSPFGGEPLYIGVTTGKNGLGQICLIGGFFFLWDILVEWRNIRIIRNRISILINILFITMIAYLFVLARSQTSLMTFFISIIILISLSLIKKQTKFIELFLIHIGIIILAISTTDFISTLFIQIGRDPTISGRTELWEYLLQLDTNPLIGTGYRSFWSGERLFNAWEKYWWHPKQAHSGYLEIYLNLGIIGLVSLLAFLISIFKNSKKELTTNFEMGKFRMAILLMALIYNYSEAAFILGCPMWFLLLLISVKIPQPLIVSDP